MPRLRDAEILAASLTVLLTFTILIAYLIGRLGVRINPFAILPLGVGAGVLTAMRLRPYTARDRAGMAAFLGLVTAIGAWLLWIARPAFLPVGAGPDLTHHLLLVDALERNWRLADSTLGAYLGEMTHYTPGLHLLAALSGPWVRSDGFHTIYAVVVLSVALKTGIAFLIALRIVPDMPARVPLAACSALLLLLPRVYYTGAFTHDSFLAQVVAELFAVAMWWALVWWDEEPSIAAAVLAAIAGIATFLTWPIWIGPPLTVLAAIVLTREGLSVRERGRHLLIGAGPVLAIAVLHALGRASWLGMAAATGAVLRPSVEALGWPFLALAIAGIVVGLFDRRARVALLLILTIAVQAGTLYVLARSRGADTPYMAFKMMYLAIYPLAVAGTLALAWVWRVTSSGVPLLQRRPGSYAAWVLVLIATVITVRSVSAMPRPAPVVSDDLYEAGRWARAHVVAACVDYLVPKADTAYWLHLAVLGNPRASVRTADPATFEPARAIARWIEPGGLPYGIAEMRTLPNEVQANIDLLAQFGTVAVVARRGQSACPELERFARHQRVTP